MNGVQQSNREHGEGGAKAHHEAPGAHRKRYGGKSEKERRSGGIIVLMEW